MTMENNKLIAEFMGGYTPYERFGDSTEYYYRGHYVALENMKFQTSWDWLMPVVNKCLNIYHIEQMNDDLNFKFYDSMGDIKKTYKEVVEFIKEYKN